MHEIIHVLLVDDAEAQYYLIEGYLRQSKTQRYHLDWVSSLEGALRRVNQREYDICLLDYELGDHTGIDVLREFQAREIEIPVIVITGYGSHDIDLAVMDAGAVDYIDKTALSAPVLERTIRYTVQQFRQTEMLRQSEIRFRAMVEKGSDLILQLDAEGRIMYNSPSVTRILGYAEDDLLGDSLGDYLHINDRPALEKMLAQLITEPNKTFNDDYRVYSSQGYWLWFEAVATNLLDVPGINAIIINAHDVTERRRLLLAEREQRTIAESLLEISNALNSTLDFDEVLACILENLGEIIQHQSGNVMLIDADGLTYAAHYWGYDDYEADITPETFQLDIMQTATLQTIINSRQPLIIPDVRQSPLWRMISLGGEVQSYIGVPVIENDDVIGFINLEACTPDDFSEKHAEYLRLFANQAVIALRNARAFRQAGELAAIEERQRLARELHDVVSQTLFSASVIADSLTRVVANGDDKLRDGLEKLTRLNRSALAEMRTLLVELRPQAVVSLPLPELLRNLVDGMRGRAEIAVELEVVGEPIQLESDAHLQLYRIAQEIFTNAYKHSRARQIHVELRYRDNRVTLAIADDGGGFDLGNIPPGHHGVRIMHERAAQIGANLAIETAPGEGAYFQVTLDVQRE